MKSVLTCWAVCMLLFLMADPDGSVWHDRKRLGSHYAKLLVSCLNGNGFVTNNTVVLCTPVEVKGR